MSSAPRADRPEAVIPFWRNVKTIGILAQFAFVIAIVAGIGVLVNNVVTALAAANLPADFSFLRNPAGIPIAELFRTRCPTPTLVRSSSASSTPLR